MLRSPTVIVNLSVSLFILSVFVSGVSLSSLT